MLYKRSRKPGAHWWVRFSVKGTEVRQSSGTDSKDLAEAFEQQLREAIWREQNLEKKSTHGKKRASGGSKKKRTSAPSNEIRKVFIPLQINYPGKYSLTLTMSISQGSSVVVTEMCLTEPEGFTDTVPAKGRHLDPFYAEPSVGDGRSIEPQR